jgi:RNA polymerase sigma-70 factor (ECF subfamily)
MKRVIQGDEQAMEQIVRTYGGSVRRYCQKMTACDCDDLAQEVFVRLWNSRHRYTSQGRFEVYLFCIARSVCRSSHRTIRRENRKREAYGKFREKQSVNVPADETKMILDQSIARLPDKMKEAVALRFAHELSYAEIAEILDTKESTARARVFHGMKRLREEVGHGLSK